MLMLTQKGDYAMTLQESGEMYLETIYRLSHSLPVVR